MSEPFPPPNEPNNPSEPALVIEAHADPIALSFRYQPAWVAAIKRCRARRWDADTRVWQVPAAQAPELLAHLEAAGVPDSSLAPLRDRVGEALAAAAGVRARSRAVYERVVPLLAERHPSLFAYQREGVAFLLRPRAERGVLLADEMGLGKTRQAIVAAHEGARPGARILVICPAGLVPNWAREIGLALGPHEAIARWGAAAEKPVRWNIISYDRLARHRKRLLATHWSCVIADEAHYLKNRQALRTRLVVGGEPATKRGKRLPFEPGIASRAERVYLLTGTPMTNRPLDLFTLLGAIGHPLGDDLLAYALRYCAAFQNGYGWDFGGASHLDELHERLAGVMLRRTRDQMLDLPPKLRTYMPVEVDLEAYRAVWTDYVARFALERKGRRRRPAKRWLLAELAKLRLAAALAKIPAALALAESVLETGAKALVFSNYHAVVDAFTAHFGARAVRVTGRDGAEKRQLAIAAFQGDPDVSLFVGNLRAAGVGLTLTAATQVIFVDYAFVPADHLQAEDRPCRIGQSRAVTVTYLSAIGTLDEEIEQLLAQKLAVVAGAIDGAAGTVAGSFLDDLLAIVARQAG